MSNDEGPVRRRVGKGPPQKSQLDSDSDDELPPAALLPSAALPLPAALPPAAPPLPAALPPAAPPPAARSRLFATRATGGNTPVGGTSTRGGTYPPGLERVTKLPAPDPAVLTPKELALQLTLHEFHYQVQVVKSLDKYIYRQGGDSYDWVQYILGLGVNDYSSLRTAIIETRPPGRAAAAAAVPLNISISAAAAAAAAAAGGAAAGGAAAAPQTGTYYTPISRELVGDDVAVAAAAAIAADLHAHNTAVREGHPSTAAAISAGNTETADAVAAADAAWKSVAGGGGGGGGGGGLPDIVPKDPNGLVNSVLKRFIDPDDPTKYKYGIIMYEMTQDADGIATIDRTKEVGKLTIKDLLDSGFFDIHLRFFFDCVPTLKVILLNLGLSTREIVSTIEYISTQWSLGDSSTVQQGQYDRNSGYAGSDRGVSQKEHADKMVVEIYKLPFFQQIAESCIPGRGSAHCNKGAGGSFMVSRRRPDRDKKGKEQVAAAYVFNGSYVYDTENFPYGVTIGQNPVGAHNIMALFSGITNQIYGEICNPAKSALKYCDKFLSVFPTTGDTNKIHATLAWPGGLLLVVLESLMFISSFNEENAFKLASIFYHFSPETLLTYAVADKIALLQKREIRRSKEYMQMRGMHGGGRGKGGKGTGRGMGRGTGTARGTGAGKRKSAASNSESNSEKEEENNNPGIREKSDSLMTNLYLHPDSSEFKKNLYKICGGKPLEYSKTLSLLAAFGVLGKKCIPGYRQLIFQTRNKNPFRENYDRGIKICVKTFSPIRKITNITVGSEHHLAFFPHFVDLLEELLKVDEYLRLKSLYSQGYELFEFFEKFVTGESDERAIMKTLDKFCDKFEDYPDFEVYDTIRKKMKDIGFISQRVLLTDGAANNAGLGMGLFTVGQGPRQAKFSGISPPLRAFQLECQRSLGMYASNVAPNPQTYLESKGVNEVTLSQRISKDTTLLLGFILVKPYNYYRYRNKILEREELEALYPIFVKCGYIREGKGETILVFNREEYRHRHTGGVCRPKRDQFHPQTIIDTLPQRGGNIEEFFIYCSTEFMDLSCKSGSVKEMAALVSLIIRIVENICMVNESTDLYSHIIKHNSEKYRDNLSKLKVDPLPVGKVYNSVLSKYKAPPSAMTQMIAQTSATLFAIKLRDEPAKPICDSDSTPNLLEGNESDSGLKDQEDITAVVDATGPSSSSSFFSSAAYLSAAPPAALAAASRAAALGFAPAASRAAAAFGAFGSVPRAAASPAAFYPPPAFGAAVPAPAAAFYPAAAAPYAAPAAAFGAPAAAFGAAPAFGSSLTLETPEQKLDRIIRGSNIQKLFMENQNIHDYVYQDIERVNLLIESFEIKQLSQLNYIAELIKSFSRKGIFSKHVIEEYTKQSEAGHVDIVSLRENAGYEIEKEVKSEQMEKVDKMLSYLDIPIIKVFMDYNP